MSKLLSEDVNTGKIDFSYIKSNKYISSPNNRKSLAIRNAKGSSYLEGISLPENFFLISYELADNNNFK